MRPSPPSPTSELGAASWIAAALDATPSRVDATVPGGFAAYARVLHPVELGDSDTFLKWADVGAETGRQVHPLVQWERLVMRHADLDRSDAVWGRGEPRVGRLHPSALRPLVALLGQHTTTPAECWFAYWQGDSGLTRSTVLTRDVLSTCRVYLHGEPYLLLRGPLSSALHLEDLAEPGWLRGQSPHLMWPDDHAWCAGTGIDFDSTIVGGTADLVDAVLGAAELESWPVAPGDSLAFDADRRNGPSKAP